MDESPVLDTSQRVMTRGLLVTTVLASVVALAAMILAASAFNRSSGAIKSNTVAIHQACLNDNQLRAAEVALWTRIFQVAPTPSDAEGAARAAALKAYIDTTFAPRDCTGP